MVITAIMRLVEALEAASVDAPKAQITVPVTGSEHLNQKEFGLAYIIAMVQGCGPSLLLPGACGGSGIWGIGIACTVPLVPCCQATMAIRMTARRARAAFSGVDRWNIDFMGQGSSSPKAARSILFLVKYSISTAQHPRCHPMGGLYRTCR